MPALHSVLRVKRRLRKVLLERTDDRGRVLDGLVADPHHGEGFAAPASEPQRHQHVGAGHRGAALMLDALVVEGPADLLAVVGHAYMPEDGLHVTRTLARTR